MRLDKLLADMQIGSRSEVKTYIRQKKVTIDGSADVRANQEVNPVVQTVCYLGKPLKYREFEYYMLYKPKGCVTARSDAVHATVMDYIDSNRKNLSPVGRLDLDTEGLLLITNDGALSHDLLSPAKHVKKTYEAMINGHVTDADAEAFRQGLDIGDDTLTRPAELEILSANEQSFIRVTITEGRFHQVKRMFQAVGKEVVYLKRISMGNLLLDETLKPGEYRELKEEEIRALKNREDSYCSHLTV
ncbi:MAG: pseudouridine synthase [Lachnospiraceae bacterium]